MKENVRHNQAAEGIDQQKHSETIRHNKISESETQRSNLAKESQAVKDLQFKYDDLAFNKDKFAQEHSLAQDQFAYKKDYDEQYLDMQERASKRQMWGNIIGSVAGVAGSGINAYGRVASAGINAAAKAAQPLTQVTKYVTPTPRDVSGLRGYYSNYGD